MVMLYIFFSEGLNVLFLYVIEGIFVIDSEGIIVWINLSVEKLFGYDFYEFNG